MRAIERFVATADIRAAVKERETDLLDALNIPWREGNPHITCPYPNHVDNNPSWRWDQQAARYFCTCGSGTILEILMKVEGIGFDQAKIRAAELLGRRDIIKEHAAQKRKGGGGKLSSRQRRNGATPDGCRLVDYAS